MFSLPKNWKRSALDVVGFLHLRLTLVGVVNRLLTGRFSTAVKVDFSQRILSPRRSRLCRVMSTSKWPLKVSEDRVQMYRARRNQYLSAAITEGDHEPEVDPYAFEEGDVKFTFSNKKDKAGGEREPGKKHKVRKVERRSERCLSERYLMCR